MTRRAGMLGLLGASLSASLGACSPVGALNALSRLGGVERIPDLAYDSGPRRRLDLYRPASDGGKLPMIVFFYGGSWQEGDKEFYRFVGASLAARGFLVAVPDYRLYPDVLYPDFLKDCATSVAWIHARAASYGGDAHWLNLMGHSAGAYNAAMLALDGRLLGAVGMAPGRDIRALVGLAGPYDFLPLTSPALKIVFGPEETRPLTQPIHYANEDAPPAWLAAGRDDDTVDPGNSSRLAAALRAQGAQAETKFYPGVGHRMLIGGFSPPLRFLAPVLSDSVAFLRARNIVA